MDIKTVTHQNPIAPSELIVTEEGRIYHLDLHPDDMQMTLLSLEIKNEFPEYLSILKRLILKELKKYVTPPGEYNGNRISVLSLE